MGTLHDDILWEHERSNGSIELYATYVHPNAIYAVLRREGNDVAEARVPHRLWEVPSVQVLNGAELDPDEEKLLQEYALAICEANVGPFRWRMRDVEDMLASFGKKEGNDGRQS